MNDSTNSRLSSFASFLAKRFVGFRYNMKWRKRPGCFERHLQRRMNNPLFPPSRRVVTKRDVMWARHKDDADATAFRKKLVDQKLWTRLLGLINQMKSPTPEWIIEAVISGDNDGLRESYRQVGPLIEEALSLGETVSKERENLESFEEVVYDFLMAHSPDDVADLLRQYRGMSQTPRVPFVHQANRSDTPILQDEEIPSLLSEDPESIRRLAFMFWVMETNTPSGTYTHGLNEVESVLKRASEEGLEEGKRQNILNAVNAGIELARRNHETTRDEPKP